MYFQFHQRISRSFCLKYEESVLWKLLHLGRPPTEKSSYLGRELIMFLCPLCRPFLLSNLWWHHHIEKCKLKLIHLTALDSYLLTYCIYPKSMYYAYLGSDKIHNTPIYQLKSNTSFMMEFKQLGPYLYEE